MIYAMLFALQFAGVALKAGQQLNVVHDRKGAIPPLSYAMTAMDLASWTTSILHVAQGGTWEFVLCVFWMGTGAWMGTLTSMALHKRVRAG